MLFHVPDPRWFPRSSPLAPNAASSHSCDWIRFSGESHGAVELKKLAREVVEEGVEEEEVEGAWTGNGWRCKKGVEAVEVGVEVE